MSQERDLVSSVAKARAGKQPPLVRIDAQRVSAAIADGWTPGEAMRQARWMADGLFSMADGLRRGWNLTGHNQPQVELALRSLERDLGVAMTDPELVDEAQALLTRLNAGDMQLMVMVNLTMSGVRWSPPVQRERDGDDAGPSPDGEAA